ncbi:MAG TPA: helix-turn-helix transcriptional regulator [Candidatus Saccharimonadales bacterium]|nr:helix-turn-helix transcriptional regulator [Candidatus Saccharimonadales bacterium]
MSKNFQVGQAIRDLRRQRNLTAEQLGKKAGLSQPRISKIETGVDANPKLEVIEKILHILDAPQTIQQQAKNALGAAGSVRLQRYNSHKPWVDTLEQERKSRSIFVFTISLIPSLLQSVEYQESLFKRRGSTPKDLQIKLQINARRQDQLWDNRRRYHFIIQETALYTLLGSPANHRAQLDRVDRLSELSNIKVGIIPYQAGAVAIDNGPFAIYDDHKVYIGVASADIFSTDADDITTYRNIFRELEKLADYGDSARLLIHKAMSYFS